MNRAIFRRLKEIIFLAVENRAQVANRFAISPFVEQFLGLTEQLQRSAIGGQEDIIADDIHSRLIGVFGGIPVTNHAPDGGKQPYLSPDVFAGE